MSSFWFCPPPTAGGKPTRAKRRRSAEVESGPTTVKVHRGSCGGPLAIADECCVVAPDVSPPHSKKERKLAKKAKRKLLHTKREEPSHNIIDIVGIWTSSCAVIIATLAQSFSFFFFLSL